MDKLVEAARRQIEFLTPLSDCQNKRDGLALANLILGLSEPDNEESLLILAKLVESVRNISGVP